MENNYYTRPAAVNCNEPFDSDTEEWLKRVWDSMFPEVEEEEEEDEDVDFWVQRMLDDDYGDYALI